MKYLFWILIVLCSTKSSTAQQLTLTFKQAAKNGIPFEHLDSIYKSAVHTDSTKAIFKSVPEQLKLQQAYKHLIRDLGEHLGENNFKWGKKVRCFNRIYFSPDGSIDYFLYNFLPLPNDPVPVEEKQRVRFEELLQKFIKNYRFELSAVEKFAQCSPVSYSDL